MKPEPVWVFAYGSLIWNPEFQVAERALGVLTGYRRGFSMRSVHLRGTEAAPGLVLALDAEAGATCHGVALRVAEGEEAAALALLRDRELRLSAYKELYVPVDLRDGRQITALAYVIDRDHRLYCGGLAPEEQAQIIARSEGERGRNCDYLWNTVAHLEELGIEDASLTRLAKRVTELTTP